MISPRYPHSRTPRSLDGEEGDIVVWSLVFLVVLCLPRAPQASPALPWMAA